MRVADGFAHMAAAIPSPVTPADRRAIAEAIDEQELTDLALTLGNIPSRSRHEKAASDFVFDWMAKEGFAPRRVGATPERSNIVGTYGGTGPGRNLLFTAHLDTESPTFDPDHDRYKYTAATLANPEWTTCWLEDGVLYGFPIANDRGPMSCFLIAAKALKKAGIRLGGHLYLTASPGEIGPEPMEENRGVSYLGKDIGAHYLFHHGGVSPDFAIAAEGCDFGLTWMGCGYAVFRLQIRGQGIFTPLLQHPETATGHSNPIYHIGRVAEAVHDWARAMEVTSRYETPGGVANPKSQLAAVRGGVPFEFGAGTEIVNLYLEVGLNPRQRAAEMQHSLEDMLRASGIDTVVVEPMVVRHGAEAREDEVAPLVAAVDAATRLTLGKPAERAASVYSSMWRDQNVFNRQGIPAITTGMKRWRPAPKDLADSALIYALTSLAICGRADDRTAPSSVRPVYGDNPFKSD